MVTTRTVGELSADTLALEELLSHVAICDVATYQQLSLVIGRDVQLTARGLLESARRRLLRDHHMLFEVVRTVGLKRLDDVGKVTAAKATMPRMRRLIRRGLKKAASIDDFDALPNQIKVEHHVTIALFGTIAHATQSSTVRKLEGRIGESLVPTAQLLDAIKETL